VPAAVTQPGFVVIDAPDRANVARLVQRLKLAVVKALVRQLAIETLDIANLHGLAGFSQMMIDAAGLSPIDKGATPAPRSGRLERSGKLDQNAFNERLHQTYRYEVSEVHFFDLIAVTEESPMYKSDATMRSSRTMRWKPAATALL
jgi:hypothetical protein